MTFLRLATLVGIFSLTFFTACGGGGDDSKPPVMPPGTENKKQDFDDLMAQANKMKDTCTNDLTPMFLILASSSQSPGGQNQMMQMIPMMMQQQQGQQDNCKNDLMNFLMALNTIQTPKGPYPNTPEGKEYAKTQIIAVMNRIYGRINAEFQARGIQLTPDQQMALQQDLLMAARVYSTNAINSGSLGPYTDPLKQAAGLS